MIKAEVVADSKNEFGNRITTMVVTFPRIILAEFNTHRMFSRNSASSRAIPFEKMVKSVEENPFIPIAWQKDHKGMQGVEYLNEEETKLAINRWKECAIESAHNAKLLHGDLNWSINDKEIYPLNVTKQLCNRLLEPFMWHTVIVTATEWENFFALRCPQYHWRTGTHDGIYRSRNDIAKYQRLPWSKEEYNDPIWFKHNYGQAEIHMMALAEAMWDTYNESIPKELKVGEWHIPYNKEIIELMKSDGTYKSYLQDLFEEEIEGTTDEAWSTNHKVIVSSMMAARTSYTVVGEDQKPWNFEKYLENGQKLIDAKPLHASPLEHCARAMSKEEFDQFLPEERPDKGWSGNFKGFIQYRKMIPNENIKK